MMKCTFLQWNVQVLQLKTRNSNEKNKKLGAMLSTEDDMSEGETLLVVCNDVTHQLALITEERPSLRLWPYVIGNLREGHIESRGS